MCRACKAGGQDKIRGPCVHTEGEAAVRLAANAPSPPALQAAARSNRAGSERTAPAMVISPPRTVKAPGVVLLSRRAAARRGSEKGTAVAAKVGRTFTRP